MEYLVVLALPVIFLGLIFIIRYRLVNKVIPQKTAKMAESVQDLSFSGFNRTEHGYRGTVRGYDVNVYATSAPGTGHMQGDLFQIWVNIAPEPGQLKGLGGFFGKYLVAGERPGFAMIGFTINYVSGSNATNDILHFLNKLIDSLTEKGIKAYFG